MQLELFENYDDSKLLEDLFQAYFNARKNKRNTINALAFEMNFESNIFDLFEEISARTYMPRPSICFVVNNPVKREIFAADFRDRVVHHLIYNYISPIFEKIFINDCYSCRAGKGTHYGINRIDRFIRSCSMNYSEKAYILKLDIMGYFMSMNRNILYKKVETGLNRFINKIDFDYQLVKYLLTKTIFSNPVENCIVKGKRSDWNDLPKTKSLFYANRDCGLPIGNLTSQLFGNIYLNEMDHYIKRVLDIKYYGRYVDDFVIVHKDKEYLKSLIPKIKVLLKEKLELTLHPNKIYLQNCQHGAQYLGAVIKPYRKYISNRTKGNFYKAILKQNKVIEKKVPNDDEEQKFLSSINSYLGIMKHYKSHNLKTKIINKYLSPLWLSLMELRKNRMILKTKFII